MQIIEILKVIFLGIVEGITEWLPISSTGHLILVDEFISLSVTDAFLEMFMVVIQLGAIMAVVVMYFPKLWPFSTNKEDHYIKMPIMTLWFKVLVATLPAIIVGLPLDDWLNEKLYNPFVVALMLILYGVLFIVVENRNKNKGLQPTTNTVQDLSYKTAALIGVFQVLALIPGTSRSGATIIGGILLGCSRAVAAEFTFYLAIPVMFGASLLKLVKFGFDFTSAEICYLLLGMVVAFGVSILAIKFLMSYIKKHDFKVFGWYRIVFGALVLLYFLVTNQLF